MTRVAVIADTHLPRGRRELPRECLRRLEEADAIVHAGDFVTVAVLRTLEGLAPVSAVHGNVDEPDLVTLLPGRRVAEIDGVRIGILHDPGPSAGRVQRLIGGFPDCRVVVYGHTHLPAASVHEGIWLLNPGSPTERRRAPAHTMLTLEIDAGDVRPELIAVRP